MFTSKQVILQKCRIEKTRQKQLTEGVTNKDNIKIINLLFK